MQFKTKKQESAFACGKAAHAAGIKRVFVLDTEAQGLLTEKGNNIATMQAWYKGWDAENLKK